MWVETCGECSGARNAKRLKLENAKKYCEDFTPEKAKGKMVDLTDDETPNWKQVQDFVNHPPAGVIVEHSEVTKTCIRVLFRAGDSPAMAKTLALS
eukprot:2184552-Pyramimonas_sp.AAC.1